MKQDRRVPPIRADAVPGHNRAPSRSGTAPTTYAQVMADIRSGRARGNGARSVSKYRNTPVVVNGERFDSKAEAKRWQMLKILERAGGITGLTRQVTVPLVINGKTIRRMRWDFAYVEEGKAILDDTKGAPATEAWLIKADFLAALRPGFQLRINGVRMKS